MLIRRAEIDGERIADLRVAGGRIAEIGQALQQKPGERVIEADGFALFPGLHDHHIHLAAYAASLGSVLCGPPDIRTMEALSARLAPLAQESGWLRGIGYHESVGGMIGCDDLDRVMPARPLRIQHRSGRLWIFNSAGLALLNPEPGDPLEREGGRLTGRLYDADDWLRKKLGSRFPSLRKASRMLAQWGVTGITDTTAANGPEEAAHFRAAQETGTLLQSVLLMGDERLDGAAFEGDLRIGPRKFHLHEAELPDLDETVAAIMRSHDAGRAAAFHCVTRTDLTFALAALEAAGAKPGDRIEHAAIAPPELLPMMRRLGVTVVSQPNFIFERGDRYLCEVAAEDRPWLYRTAGLRGIPIAGGTDAPFGAANPWALMNAAVHRRTRSGVIMGEEERLTAEEALGLFLGAPEDPGGPRRRIHIGAPADLILLDRNWRLAREDLAAARVKATLKAGAVIS